MVDRIVGKVVENVYTIRTDGTGILVKAVISFYVDKVYKVWIIFIYVYHVAEDILVRWL